MRITYLSADRGIPVGGTKGAAAHVRGLLGAFRDLGHDVSLVSPGAAATPPPVSGVRFVPVPPSETAVAGREALEPPLGRALAHLWNNGGVEAALRDLWDEAAPDLLYERLSPFGLAGSVLASRRDVFHVLEVNAPLAWEGKQYRRQALSEAAEALEHTALASADLVVTVSRELAEILESEGVPEAKIRVVPNGVDTELFSSNGNGNPVRSGSRVVLGFVGSLKPWHGIEILVEAFETLAVDSRYHLLVVGSGPASRLVTGLADRHPGRVTWIRDSEHHEVPGHLSGVDIAVAPYPELERFYYSPLKILEYMASGRTIVASAIGQIPDLLDGGRLGVLVKPGDPRELVAAVEALVADPSRRAALGNHARKEALQSHRWIDRARKILETVEGVQGC